MYRENRTSRTFSESKKWEEGIFFFHVELKSFEVILEESLRVRGCMGHASLDGGLIA